MPPPRPHPLARAPLVDRLDGFLATCWERGWTQPVPLNPEGLLERGGKGLDRADEASGRSDEDVADFRLRLEQLCQSIADDAALNSLGETFAYGLITRAIQQRLALGAIWRERPEFLATQIADPVIVVGQMRSGTTRIHRLLAADPAHSATRFCDSWHPVPETPDFRPLRGGFKLFMARRLDPWIDALHPFGATRADEELGWLASALDHSAYEAQWRIPSYVAFSEARDPAPIYREFDRLLRTDAAQRGNAGLPRILKVPQFTEDLAALLKQFPGARLVVSRRSSEETLRSSVSLVANQMVIQSDTVDLDWIEQEWTRKIALRQTRMEDALAGFSGKIAFLDFEGLNEDWRGEIARTYAALDLDLTPQALKAMEAAQRKAEHSTHLEHAKAYLNFKQ